MPSPLLIAHIGAGNHSKKNEKEYKKLIKLSLNPHTDGIHAIIECSKVLDDSPLTNTGYGSSLNILGKISNDASILQFKDGKMSHFGVVNDINHKYPLFECIEMFKDIDELYINKKLKSIGLTKPKIIHYSAKRNIYEMLGKSYNQQECEIPEKEQKLFEIFQKGLLNTVDETVQDTVGIIHINDDITTIGTSSGGNFLKLPGRVGCAGVIGAGIDFKLKESQEVSCACSGNGEDIIMMKLANYMVTEWDQDISTLNQALQSKWSNIHTDRSKLYVGVIIVIKEKDTNDIRIIYYHTTETFYFGFQYHSTKIITSRLDKEPYIVGEYHIS